MSPWIFNIEIYFPIRCKVRLRFEPAGRPVEDGIYYIQEKENKCVVCGSETDNNIRKNIIPQVSRVDHVVPLGTFDEWPFIDRISRFFPCVSFQTLI